MTTRNKQKKKNMKEEQWEKEFDKKFVPKYPKSGFEPIDGLTANVFTIKQFISTIFKTQRQEIIVEIEIKEKVIIQILRNIDTDEDTIRDIIDVFTDLK